MMATATLKKPRTSIEAVPQLATLPERVAVVEVKIQSIEVKIDDLKIMSKICMTALIRLWMV